MGWSTRRLADLTNTTVRSIRHYHDVGLLPQPPRLGNGYKEYQLEHLMRVLQIKRLTSIGMTLTQVRSSLADPKEGVELLDSIEEELDEQIAALQEAKTEVDALKALHLSPNIPSTLVTNFGFEPREATSGETQLVFLVSQIEDLSAVNIAAELEDPKIDHLSKEFRRLPADASLKEQHRLCQALVLALKPYIDGQRQTVGAGQQAPSQQGGLQDVLDQAVTSYLNPAQASIMRELHKAIDINPEARVDSV